MREIIIGDHTFKWQNSYTEVYEYGGSNPITNFYYGEEEVTNRKYIFFGPIIKISMRPKLAFSIYAHLDSPNYTNEQLKEAVMKKYNHWVGMQVRAEKIAKEEFL